MTPQGGTEIQHRLLSHYVDEKLLSNFQICTSIPGKIPLSEDKINILWQKNSYDQPNIYPWFEDKTNHDKFDWYVFNSHWNYEKFRYRFDIPTHKCHVIKNGVDNFPDRLPYREGNMVRLLFHVTPWRGLNVLLGAMQQLQDCNVHLDVFSSCKIYGEEFEKNNEAKYEPLYETCSEFPAYVTYDKDYKRLSTVFADAIRQAVTTLHEPGVQKHLDVQQDFVKRFYSWEKKKQEWTNFLTGALNAKKRTPVHA